MCADFVRVGSGPCRVRVVEFSYNCTHYAKLYPQNGDRIVTIVSATSIRGSAVNAADLAGKVDDPVSGGQRRVSDQRALDVGRRQKLDGDFALMD